MTRLRSPGENFLAEMQIGTGSCGDFELPPDAVLWDEVSGEVLEDPGIVRPGSEGGKATGQVGCSQDLDGDVVFIG